jgi:hypothetical protein
MYKVRELIETDFDLTLDNRFMKNLNYQIGKNSVFYKNFPTYYKQLCDFKTQFGVEETIKILKKNFEAKRLRDAYATVIAEFKELLNQYNDKK